MVDMEVEPFSRSVLHVIHLKPCFSGGVKKKLETFAGLCLSPLLVVKGLSYMQFNLNLRCMYGLQSSRHQRNRHQEFDSPPSNSPPSNDSALIDMFAHLGLLT